MSWTESNSYESTHVNVCGREREGEGSNCILLYTYYLSIEHRDEQRRLLGQLDVQCTTSQRFNKMLYIIILMANMKWGAWMMVIHRLGSWACTPMRWLVETLASCTLNIKLSTENLLCFSIYTRTDTTYTHTHTKSRQIVGGLPITWPYPIVSKD